MKELLEQLKKLVIHKEYRKIKKLLEEADKYIKGKLFEEFLAMLFEGNGFIATIKGELLMEEQIYFYLILIILIR